MSKELSKLQKLYYDERVNFIKCMGIAVPYGLIRNWAEEKSDEQCKEWFKDGEPKNWLESKGIELDTKQK